jgi:hypothetical protein
VRNQAVIRPEEYRSAEDVPQIVDSTPPADRAFIAFGGPQAHGHSITVAAQNGPLIACAPYPSRDSD